MYDMAACGTRFGMVRSVQHSTCLRAAASHEPVKMAVNNVGVASLRISFGASLLVLVPAIFLHFKDKGLSTS
jgi:hypothetical protein